jgi:N-methylhydantoinase B
MSTMRGQIDPITLEVIQEAMISIVREMRANLVATAYSSIIYEAHDFSCVLVDGAGQIIAQAEDNPSHIFPVPWSVRQMMERFKGDIYPGDVFLHNDPYTGGTHLNDIAMIFPVFADGKLVLFPAVRAHWGDVGGSTPGSISGKSTEIFHDGVRLPIVRIAHRGKLNQDLFDVMIANMRVPRERRGDFMSTWGTCQVAERRVTELMARYGIATVSGAMAELLDRAERRMRSKIAALKDGDYVYEHCLDPVGVQAEPVRARATLRVRGDSMVVDFAGSSPQVNGSLNAGAAVAATGAFIVLKSFLDPGEPINHGNFRPVDVQVPEGTFLNARYPASCAGSSEVRNAAISVVLGAMSKAMPGSMAGDIKGTSNHVYVGGNDVRRMDPYLFYEYPAGGTGGTAHGDGSNAVRNFAEGDFSSIQPAEAIEHESALLVERCEIRQDSCGAGRNRGGYGLRRDIRVVGDGAILSISSNKNVLPPFGVGGGMPGAPNDFVVIRNGREIAPSDTPGKVSGFRLAKEDIVSMRTSGGGGYGDPLERDPALVLEDVRQGYLSAERAKEAFGTMIRGGKLDAAATQRLRSTVRGQRRSLRVVRPSKALPAEGRQWCALAPATLGALGLHDREACELADPAGPSLRIWVMTDPSVPPDTIALDDLARNVLCVKDGDAVALRRLKLTGAA